MAAHLLCFFAGRKLMIGSSLLKQVDTNAIKNCSVIPRPGKTFRSMTLEIHSNKLSIEGVDILGILLGTNDLSDLVYCRFGLVGSKKLFKHPILPKSFVDMAKIQLDFLWLIDTIRQKNPGVTLVICGTLPRLGDWYWSREPSFALNAFLEKWVRQQAAAGHQALYVPAYKFFQKNGLPCREYYKWDGVHLSAKGGARLTQCLQQALSDANIRRGGVWKRRSLDQLKSTGMRIRKVSGNLVVFLIWWRRWDLCLMYVFLGLALRVWRCLGKWRGVPRVLWVKPGLVCCRLLTIIVAFIKCIGKVMPH